MTEVAYIGARVGQYRLAREIGHGGMGVVYEAVHDEIGRRAAIKLLSSRCSGDPRYVRRFLNEARAVSRVCHPGLVQIYDFGQTDSGVPYILMELIDGDTLRGRMSGRATDGAPLRVTDVCTTARQIAAALAATHDAGIVHRDLKPENVMLVADDEAASGERVKLLDFGIARFINDEDSTLTSPGFLLGTAAYMSPEQCAGDPEVGAPADVYALGVVMHELITGAHPFSGPNSSEVMRQHLVAEPPPLPESAPATLARLVARMLAKEPTRRPTMRDIVEALSERAVTAAPVIARSPATPIAPNFQPIETAPVVNSPALLDPLPRKARRVNVLWFLMIAGLGGTFVWRACGSLRDPERLSPPAQLAGMVWFSGGVFRMGHTAAEVATECARLGSGCRRDLLDREQPAREVTLSPFFLDRFEATNDEVARWLNTMRPSIEMRSDDEQHIDRWVYLGGLELLDLWLPSSGIVRTPEGGFAARPSHERKPVVQITWDGAALYCKGRGKRLPTEAEWEFAAHGLTARRFPWGDREPRCEDVVWGRSAGMPCAAQSGTPGPLAVGSASLDRTPEGVFDMGGNVAEWVQDQFTKPYLPPCGACVNPRIEEPVPLQEDWRVIRGASWGNSWYISRSTMRGRWKRIEAPSSLGVRCASD